MNRVLAIGDIHGCLTALDTLLTVVKPDARDTSATTLTGAQTREALLNGSSLSWTKHTLSPCAATTI